MPSSLRPARDDERHDAVEADGREQRRQQAEAGGEQRNQSIGQQRLVELRFDGLELIDRHRRHRGCFTSPRMRLYALDGARRRCARRTSRCSCPSSE